MDEFWRVILTCIVYFWEKIQQEIQSVHAGLPCSWLIKVHNWWVAKFSFRVHFVGIFGLLSTINFAALQSTVTFMLVCGEFFHLQNKIHSCVFFECTFILNGIMVSLFITIDSFSMLVCISSRHPCNRINSNKLPPSLYEC